MSTDDEPDTLTRMTRDALGPDARPAESFDELYRRVHEAKERAWAKADPVTVYTTDIHRLNRSFIHAPWWPLLSDDDVRGLDTIRLDLVRVGDTLRSNGGGKFSIDIYHQSVQEIRVTDVSSTTDGALALLAARARADAVTHREQAERLDRIAQLVEEGLKPTELETKRYSYPEYETVKIKRSTDGPPITASGGRGGSDPFSDKMPSPPEGHDYDPVDPLATGPYVDNGESQITAALERDLAGHIVPGSVIVKTGEPE